MTGQGIINSSTKPLNIKQKITCKVKDCFDKLNSPNKQKQQKNKNNKNKKKNNKNKTTPPWLSRKLLKKV
jgi:hypothetical protein